MVHMFESLLDGGGVANTALSSVICDKEIQGLLDRKPEGSLMRACDILQKARELKGLTLEEVVSLMNVTDRDMIHQLHETARWVKNEIYGSRLVLFAPLYISNACTNECTYCAFRRGNAALQRRTLTQEEIAREVRVLVSQGHKRLLLVAGEDY